MIKCFLETESLELAPGATSQVRLTVVNRSPIIDYFAVSLQPRPTNISNPISANARELDPAWLNIAPANFSLRPPIPGREDADPPDADSSQIITIAVRVPQDVTAGQYSTQIVISANSGPDNSTVLPFSIIVSEVEEQTLTLVPNERVSRRSTEVFQIALHNQGNRPRLYSLYAEDGNYGCRYTVIPPEVTLNPGERTNLTLKVNPRWRNWIGFERNYDFTVKIDNFEEEASGRFIQRCALPPLFFMRRHLLWFVMAFGILFTVLGVLIFLVLPGLFTQINSDCGPQSLRKVEVYSNNISTDIYVSDRNGQGPMRKVASKYVTDLPGLFANMVTVSPNGLRLAYVTANNESLDGAQVWLVDLENPNKQPLLLAKIDSGLWPTTPIWTSDGQALSLVVRSKTSVNFTRGTPSPAATAQLTAPVGITSTLAAGSTVSATVQEGSTKGLAAFEIWTLRLTDTGSAAAGASVQQTPVPADLNMQLRMFYGDDPYTARPICWNRYDTAILLRPKPDQYNPTGKIYGLKSDGSIAAIQLPAAAQELSNLVTRVGPTKGPRATATPAPTAIAGAAGGGSTAAGACAVKNIFSQNDPQWAYLTMDKEKRFKLGDYGCAIVAAATVLNYYGADTDPRTLLQCIDTDASPLTQVGWYNIASTKCGSNKMSGGTRGDFSWENLDRALQNGPTILGLLGGQTGTHWVVVNSSGQGLADGYHVSDPWDGSTYKTLNYFISLGYHPRWIINYKGDALACGVQDTNLAASQVAVGGVRDGVAYQVPQSLRYNVDGASVVSGTLKLLDPKDQAISNKDVVVKPDSPFSVQTQGDYRLLVTAKNPDGDKDIIRNVWFSIDRQAPILTYTTNVQPNRNGHYTAPLSVTLLAYDPWSGVASLQYQIIKRPRINVNNNNPPSVGNPSALNGFELANQTGNWITYNSDTTSRPLGITEGGTYQVLYRAVDGAGNMNNPFGIIQFEVDGPGGVDSGNTAPVIQPSPTPAAATTPAPVAPVIVPPTPRPPAPRQTTAAANNGGNGGSTGPRRNKLYEDVTATPLGNVPTPSPTGGVSLLPTPIITTTPGTPSTTPTATVTPTPNLLPLLDVSSTQFTFNPDNTAPQSLVITNKGGSALTWSLTLNDASVGLLNFSQVGGVLAPGASATVSLSVINPTLIFSKQNVTFKVASDGGNKDISVTINPEPLPQATIVSPAVGPLDAQAPVKLNVVANGSAIQADHAIITATYQTCPAGNCQKTTQTILTLTSPWSGTWDNSSLTAQTGISLKGSLCISTDDSICSAIPQVDGYSIPTLAYFVAPTTGITLTDVTSIVVSHTNRVTGVDLFWNYQNNPNSVPNKFGSVGSFNNWQYAWNTLTFTPTVPIQLSGVAYFDGASGTVTQSLPSVTDLKTAMTANVVFSQDLNTNKILTDVLTATVTSPSQNIDHIGIVATWNKTNTNGTVTNAYSQTVILVGKTQGWSGSWNLADPSYGLKPQAGITIQVIACFDQAGTFCQALVSPYTNLIKSAGPPNSLKVSPSVPQYPFVNSPLNQTFVVTVTDVDGNGINGAYVTFAAPSTGASLIFANGSYTSTFGPADSNGSITVSGIKTNGIPSNSSPYELLVSVATPVVATPPSVSIKIYNKSTNSPYLESQPVTQSAKVNTLMSPFTLKALTGNGTPYSGSVQVTYTITGDSSTPSALFTGSLPAGTTCSSATVCTALITSGSVTLPSIQTNTIAGDYNIFVTGIDTQNGTYFVPWYIYLTNLADDPASLKLVSGDAQTAPARTAFANPLVVLAQDKYNNPVPNASVTFQANSSGGTQAPVFGSNSSVTVQSNSLGSATSPTLIAGSKAGPFNVVASLSSVTGSPSITFTENTTAGPAAQIVPAPGNTGNLQDADINTAFTNPLRVQVQDQDSNVVNSNATVSFNITLAANGASGTFSGTLTNLSSVPVDSAGIVTANGLTANAIEGSFKVIASLDGKSSTVAFTENNLGPFNIGLQGGNNQTTQINKAFLTNLQVKVTDKNGTAMVGVPVTFTITPNATGGASATFPGNASFMAVNTGAAGFATTTTPPTANQYDGSFTVVVQTANGKSATFTLTNLGVETISVVNGNNQHLYKNQTGSALTVHVVDINNQPLAGVVVTFQTNPASDPQYVPIPQGNFGGQFSVTATTNGSGDATTSNPLGAGPNGGIWSVTASATKNLAVAPRTVSFTEITVGDPKTMLCVSGDGQTTYNNQNFGAPLIIRVVDRYNNGRAGVPVNVTSNTTNGQPLVNLTGSTNTDYNGYITVTMQVGNSNNNAGTFSVSATTSGGINPNPTCTFNTETIFGVPRTIKATPNAQSASIAAATSFTPLTINVKDKAGQNIPFANVVVTIQAGGPTFTGGSVTFTGSTDSAGNVTTPAIVTGSTAGSYTVSVNASDAGGPLPGGATVAAQLVVTP